MGGHEEDSHCLLAKGPGRHVVFIRDKRIRTRPAELDAFRAAGLRAFGLASKRDLSTWDYLVRVVRHWDAIETLVAERVAGPWFMAIGERDVTDVALAPARHGRSRQGPVVVPGRGG